jgi:hypothetical protein
VAVKRIREDRRRLKNDDGYQKYVNQAITELQVRSGNGSGPGLPDFSWYNIPKRGKYTKMTTKRYQNNHKTIPKWP